MRDRIVLGVTLGNGAIPVILSKIGVFYAQSADGNTIFFIDLFLRMPKPFVPDYQRKTIPLVPMIAISCVSFLDNFCYSLVNPIIPYMTLEYLPDVRMLLLSHL